MLPARTHLAERRGSIPRVYVQHSSIAEGCWRGMRLILEEHVPRAQQAGGTDLTFEFGLNCCWPWLNLASSSQVLHAERRMLGCCGRSNGPAALLSGQSGIPCGWERITMLPLL